MHRDIVLVILIGADHSSILTTYLITKHFHRHHVYFITLNLPGLIEKGGYSASGYVPQIVYNKHKNITHMY